MIDKFEPMKCEFSAKVFSIDTVTTLKGQHKNENFLTKIMIN